VDAFLSEFQTILYNGPDKVAQLNRRMASNLVVGYPKYRDYYFSTKIFVYLLVPISSSNGCLRVYMHVPDFDIRNGALKLIF
jgi:hypothetical protein